MYNLQQPTTGIKTMPANELSNRIKECLNDYKAIDVTELDVSNLTSVTDKMIIATASSNRHAQTLAEKVMERLRMAGIRPTYTNVDVDSDWQVLDYMDVVVHIMIAEARELYNLEQLWQTTEQQRNNNAN